MAKKENRTVIHLQIGELHQYFGSVSSLFDKYSSNELGITQGALNNYWISSKCKENMGVYSNKSCIIRKGILYVKPTTRGRKKVIDDITE